MELQPFPLNANAYELLSEVGEGATAKVYRARCIPLDKEVAVKIINLDRTNMAIEQFQREITIMTKSCHPNVLRLWGSFVVGNSIWLVLEYHPFGSVADVLKAINQQGFREEKLLVALLYQALLALRYFHDNGQMHRDVKAANLLIASGGEVRMADFGVSSEPPSCRRSVTRQTFVGTPCWMAPEVLTMRGYRKSADIWSMGITALELAFGTPPYAQHPPMKVMALILKADPPTVDQCGANDFSPEFKAFVSKCLQKDPTHRPTASQLLKEPLFQRFPSVDDAIKIVRERFAGIPTLKERNPKLPATGDCGSNDSWDFPTLTPSDSPGAAPPPDAPKWRVDSHTSHLVLSAEYTLGEVIGKLGPLTLFNATVKRTQKQVCFHQLELESARYTDAILTDDTVDTALSISSPGLLSCYEVWEDGVASLFWVTDVKSGGSLRNYINLVKASSGRVPPGTVKKFALRLLSGIQALHQNNVIHRRISPHNIFISNDGMPLLDATPSIVLPGMLLSFFKVDSGHGGNAVMNEAYMPPEQFDEQYGQQVDIYSFGITVLEMLTGLVPYSEVRNTIKLVQLKCAGKSPQALAALDDPKWRSIIDRCLLSTPEDRPTAEELISIIESEAPDD